MITRKQLKCYPKKVLQLEYGKMELRAFNQILPSFNVHESHLKSY